MTEQNWTKEEIHAAVMRGTHNSALAEEAIAHFAAEAKEKEASNQAHLVCYKLFKGDFTTRMKVPHIAETPCKSKAFRSILDLSFSLKLTPHGRVPLVNENNKKTALGVSNDQIVHVLLRLIHGFAEAPDCAKILQAKWDINDGFGRLDCK